MKIFDKGLILPPPLNFKHSLKIFNKGLILPPPLNFYLHFEDLQQGFGDDDDDDGDDDDGDDDDDDALPVMVAVPGKAQAFAVYK